MHENGQGYFDAGNQLVHPPDSLTTAQVVAKSQKC